MYNIKYFNINFDIESDPGNLEKHITSHVSQLALEGKSYYKVLSPINIHEQLSGLDQLANKIRNNFVNLIVIGMGGATLNPSAVISLIKPKSRNTAFKIHFLDNTDPYYFRELLSNLELRDTAFLTISNSGQTLETLSLLGCVIEECRKLNINTDRDNFYFITNKTDNALINIAKQIGGIILPHEQHISGRYSGLTNVTTFAVMILGLNPEEYLIGAKEVLTDFHQNLAYSKPVKAARAIYHSSKHTMINVGYLQRFASYLEWYSQIISESLGKNSSGYTPVKGLGPNDQHSMFQLYLGGPPDKIFTMFYADLDDNSSQTKAIDLQALGDIAGKDLSSINEINFTAASTALIKQQLPVRKFILDSLQERSIGALIAHSMVEIIVLAHFLQVNPFDQPGVELIKSEALELLKNKK